MTPEKARQKICPMMIGHNSTDGDPGGVENCWANRCAVWVVLETEEAAGYANPNSPTMSTPYSVKDAKEVGWVRRGIRWGRPIPMETQPGQCGLITKGSK